MRPVVTRLMPDRRREKVLVEDCPEAGRPIDNLVARGLVKIGPVLQDVVPAAEAKRIHDTLRDEPGKLFGTVFDWKGA